MLEARSRNIGEKTEKGEILRFQITHATQSEFQKTDLLYGETLSKEKVVLKFPREPESAYREWEGLSLAYANGIKVPKPIAQLEREDEPIFGFAMEQIVGNPITDKSNPNVRRLLGAEVRNMHQIELPGYGIHKNGEATFSSKDEYDTYWLELTLPYTPKHSEGNKVLNDLFAETRNPALDTPKFLHRDLKVDNTIITPDNKVFLLDFEWWQGGDPMDDLGNHLYHSLRNREPHDRYQAFLDGYFDTERVTDHHLYNILFYTTLAATRFVRYCSKFNPNMLPEALNSYTHTLDFVKTRVN